MVGWPAAGFVDTGLGSHSSLLERHRAEIAQLGMAPRGVVEALRCNRRLACPHRVVRFQS